VWRHPHQQQLQQALSFPNHTRLATAAPLLLLPRCCCRLVLLAATPTRFDGLSGSLPNGMPRLEVPQEVLDSIRTNGVSLQCAT
jgi:hypothetical protein